MNISRRGFTDIFVYHTRDEAHSHSKFNMHTHSMAELFCFISGQAVYHIEGSKYVLQPGDILLMRPAEAHYIQTDPEYPYERLFLNFDTNILTALDPENVLMRPFFDRKAGKRNLLRASDFGSDHYRRYLESMTDPNANRLTVIANLILLMQEIVRVFDRDPATSQPDTIEYRIIRYINKNLDRELSIQELCDKFYISRAQLCRRFKQSTGTSVGRYISVKRLITAQNLIRQGQKPTEIFAACGYQDYSTFYRAYTHYFAHSPSSERDTQRILHPETDQIEIV